MTEAKLPAEFFGGSRSAYGWMMLRGEDEMEDEAPSQQPAIEPPAYKRFACRRPLPGEE